MKWLIILLLVLLFCVSLPISNLFTKRTYVATNDEDPEFKQVSDILVKKCADCHTQDLAQHPLYFGFPIAESIIHKNIKNGQKSFLLNRNKLSGKEQFSANDILKLTSAMAKNNMPPKQYLMLHWDSELSEAEQKLLVTWIRKRAKIFDIRPIPQENFLKPNEAKAALGQQLFNDKSLSADNSVSCASCHSIEKGGTDNLKAARGAGGVQGTLNTPTVLNAAYNIRQYWDGRARDLKAQVGIAVSNKSELASSWSQVLANVSKQGKYSAEFKSLYPEGITADSISDAIAEYENTLLTPGSRFDKFLMGDKSALSADEKAGFEVFKKHECYDCHSGPAFGGLSFELMGYNTPYFAKGESPNKDENGRFNVTQSLSDLHKFKVPTLRNIELTYPYLHDGSASTLEDAVKAMSKYQIEKPLTESECKQVVAFLRSLTGCLNGKPLK